MMLVIGTLVVISIRIMLRVFKGGKTVAFTPSSIKHLAVEDQSEILSIAAQEFVDFYGALTLPKRNAQKDLNPIQFQELIKICQLIENANTVEEFQRKASDIARTSEALNY